MSQLKEQDKTPEQLSEVEIGNLSLKEFRIMRVTMMQDLGKRKKERKKKEKKEKRREEKKRKEKKKEKKRKKKRKKTGNS